MRKVRSRCQVSLVQTQIRLDAIQHEKSTSGSITMCWGVPLLHISRTQSTIALSSAEAELHAMGQTLRASTVSKS
eukprot:3819629-Amphidinium_carterae.7